MAHLEHGDSIQSSTHDIWAMGTDSPYIWGGLLRSHGYTASRLIASAIKPDTSPDWIYLRLARRANHARRLSSITILSAMVRRFSCTLCSILAYSAPRLLSQLSRPPNSREHEPLAIPTEPYISVGCPRTGHRAQHRSRTFLIMLLLTPSAPRHSVTIHSTTS